MLISKIISGGQTGVDRGAIEAALELGFPYGGLIPKGRLAEDGAVPEKFDRMEVAPKKSACLLLGEPRAEMRGDAGRAEAVVQNRLDDDVVALDVVIDGEREVRNHHAVVSEVDGVYACEISEGIERGDGPLGGLLRPTSRKPESCLRRRDVRGGQARVRAIPAARMHRKPIQATTKGSPSPELSARHPSRRFFALQLACSISPFAVSIAKKTGVWKVVFECARKCLQQGETKCRR